MLVNIYALKLWTEGNRAYGSQKVAMFGGAMIALVFLWGNDKSIPVRSFHKETTNTTNPWFHVVGLDSSFDSNAFLERFIFPIMRLLSLEKNNINLLTELITLLRHSIIQKMGCGECVMATGET